MKTAWNVHGGFNGAGLGAFCTPTGRGRLDLATRNSSDAAVRQHLCLAPRLARRLLIGESLAAPNRCALCRAKKRSRFAVEGGFAVSPRPDLPSNCILHPSFSLAGEPLAASLLYSNAAKVHPRRGQVRARTSACGVVVALRSAYWAYLGGPEITRSGFASAQ